MADNDLLQSPKHNYKKPFSSFFISPKLFTGFISKSSNDMIMTSPTSILDPLPFPPVSSSNNTPRKQEKKCLWDKLDSRGVGLALVDSLIDEKTDSNLSKTVIFGSQLKIQVPPLFSPVFSSLSASEMELSEDYTCVISYGPNPRTTHIFDDCIFESCCGVVKLSGSRKENGFLPDGSMGYPSENFLSFCFNCRKNLGQGKDIYMYRGEKAFCSNDCRCKEMMLDDEAMEGL